MVVTFDTNEHVYRCDKCKQAVFESHNKRNDGTWKCYKCGHIMTQCPNFRSKRDSWQPLHKKKSTPNKDIETEKDLIKKLEEYCGDYYWMKKKDVRDVAFIAILYLTGARVSEIVGLKDSGVRNPKDKETYIEGKEPKVIFEGIRGNQIVFDEEYDVPVIMFKDIPTLKRRDLGISKEDAKLIDDHYPRKDFTIPIDHNRKMINFIIRFKKTILNDTDLLFKFSPTMAWIICDKVIGKNPHFIRHCRISDLIRIYAFNDNQIQHYIGWTSSAMAARYTHLHARDLVKSMIMKYNEQKKLMLSSGLNGE